MTDRELLEEFRTSRSQSAFAELVRRHVDWVHGVASRRLRDPHLADDVTQAAFIVLARKVPRLSAGRTLSAWLFTVVNYGCKQMLRLDQRRRFHETEAAKMRTQRLSIKADQTEAGQVFAILDDSVTALGYRDRQAVLLRFYEQKSYPEIGRALSISEEAARKRVSRAVDTLRGKLSRRGVAIPASTLMTMLAVNLPASTSPAVIAAIARQGAATVPSAVAVSLAKGVVTMHALNGKIAVGAAAAVLLVVAAVAVFKYSSLAQVSTPSSVVGALGAPTTSPSALMATMRPVSDDLRQSVRAWIHGQGQIRDSAPPPETAPRIEWAAVLPELHEMLSDPAEARYWGAVVSRISGTMVQTDAAQFHLNFLRRKEDWDGVAAGGDLTYRVMSLKWQRLVAFGQTGGADVADQLKSAISEQGAAELAKEWIDAPQVLAELRRSRIINHIRGQAAQGLLYTRTPENFKILETLYREQLRVHEATGEYDLMNALSNVMALHDLIEDVGFEKHLEVKTRFMGRDFTTYVQKRLAERPNPVTRPVQ